MAVAGAEPTATPTAEALPEGIDAAAFENFDRWAEQAATEKTASPAQIEKGIKLAEARTTELEKLIEIAPELALKRAVHPAVRVKLPAQVDEHLAKRVSGHGTYRVMIALGADNQSHVQRDVVIHGQRYNAFVYGQRLGRKSKGNIPLYGIAVGQNMAVDASPVRLLEPGEEPGPFAKVANADGACPVSGIVSSREVVAQSGDTIYYLCSGGHIMALQQQLLADEGGGEVAQSAWTEGTKTIVYIRVNFPDALGDPQSVSNCESMFASGNDFFKKNSYNKTDWTWTITPLLTMPKNRADYADEYALRADALALAKANGYDTADYDLNCVRYSGGPGSFSGAAYVGFPGCWMKSSSFGVLCHELGHNYGLWHANSWTASNDSVIGAGSHVEYGDSFDTMGSASAGIKHFNSYEKNKLNWIPDANVQTISASGTYRVYANDTATSIAGGSYYALKVLKNSTTSDDYTNPDYWLSARDLYTTNRWESNGVELHWLPWQKSNGGTHLLDTTPSSRDGKNDSAIVVGRTFSDRIYGLHFTAVKKNATTPVSYDVVVNIGQFSSNRAPALALSASATSAGTGTSVSFTASASDADGDPLAYYWDFGDYTFGTNAPAAAKSWSTAGDYAVCCTASDMKGGLAIKTIVVHVGSPATFKVSGVVKDTAGNPIQGVLVQNGLSSADRRDAYTNLDGSYTITNLASGSYTFKASIDGYTMAASGFTNPLSVSANASGINFTGTKNVYAISGTIKDTTGAVMPGVTVVADGKTKSTDSAGKYSIGGVANGLYLVAATKSGYVFTVPYGNNNPVAVHAGNATLDFTGQAGGSNTAPVANNQSVTTNEDTAKAISLRATDADGDPLAYSIVSGPAHGTLSGSGGGPGGGGGPEQTYTPNANYSGSDSFTFRVNDGTVNSNTATVSITVNAVNAAPVANNQSIITNEDTAKAITLTGTDADGDPLTYSIVANPTHGTLSGSGVNRTYTPNANYNGSDSFTFRVNDGTMNSNTATVSITVKAVNDAPVANNQSITTNEDTAKAITLSATDADGDPLTYSIVANPTHGTLSGSGASRTYTPNANYSGSDSFTFRVNDGTVNSNTATVSITVTAVNDAPVANAQSVSTPKSTAKTITLTGSDVEGSTLTYSITTNPTHGTLSGSGANRTYTPNAGYVGSDSFTFKVNDGSLNSAAATVSITVTDTNDAPVANNQSVTTNEDTAKAITLSATDADGDSLTYSIVANPTKGTLSGTGASRTYTPNANYNGSDSFTFRVNDGTVNSNTATVSITVAAVNDAPVANNQSITTNEDTAKAITLSATDADGNSLTYSIVANPTKGTLSGSGANRTYTPNAGYVGSDSFTFKVNDGTANSNTATVSITVKAVNDAPQFVSAACAVPNPANIGQTVSFTAAASDIDNATLTYTWNFGDGASASGSSVTHAYSAAGTYTATVTASDSSLNDTSSVTVVVNAPGGGGSTPPGGGGGGNADSDGDGVSDAEEIAQGTNPLDPNSFPAHAMTVSKASGKASFKVTGADSCSVKGILPDVKPIANTDGMVLDVDVGGAKETFVLDSRGRGKTANGRLSLRLKPSVRNKATRALEFQGGDVAYSISLKYGSWSDEWGMNGETVRGQMTVRVVIRFAGTIYASTVDCGLISKEGSGARFKN